MITNALEFEESTAFELYVLETVRPAIDQHSGAYIDLRGSKTVAAVGITINESLSAGAVDRLKDKLAPLLFGAAWKVFDLLLEFGLNKAGLRPARRDWSIAEKQQHAVNGAGDRSVLGCSKATWDAMLRVYGATVEHRHCLVHRTAKVDADTGTLEGIDRNRRPLTPLTREHQIALAKAAGLVARATVKGGIDLRSEDHLKYQLDLLASHSGAPVFGVGGASAPIDILLALEQESGAYFLDMNGVLERARRTFATVAHFNLLVHLPDESSRRLFARAEDCPPGRTAIDLKALPSWLEYR